MKLKVLTGFIDIHTNKYNGVGDIIEVSDKRNEELKSNLEAFGGYSLFLEQIVDEQKDEVVETKPKRTKKKDVEEVVEE